MQRITLSTGLLLLCSMLLFADDTPATAVVISVPHSGEYSVETEGDVDWYRMYLYAGENWNMVTELINGSALDPEFHFYGPFPGDGNGLDQSDPLVSNDDSGPGLNPLIDFTVANEGYYFLRVAYYANNPLRDDTGDYRLVISSDGNDGPASATPIDILPHTGDYSIEPLNDQDWYRMAFTAGEAWSMTTELINGSTLDAEFYLYGPAASNGSDVNTSEWTVVNDDGGEGLNPLIEFDVDTTGYYYLRVAYYSNNPIRDDRDYRLIITSMTTNYEIEVIQPIAFTAVEQGADVTISWNAAAPAGSEVTLFHDTDSDWTNGTTGTIASDQGTSDSYIWNTAGVLPGSYFIAARVSGSTGSAVDYSGGMITVYSSDNDNSPDLANAVALPWFSTYGIYPEDDIDWYRAYMTAGETWHMTTNNVHGASLDPEFYLYGPHASDGSDLDPSSAIDVDDDSGPGFNPLLNFTVSESGYYFLRVAHYANNPMGALNGESKPEFDATRDEGLRAATGDYRLVLSVDGNDCPPLAVGMTAPDSVDAAVEIVGDQDWYSFYMVPGTVWEFTTILINGSDLDAEFHLYGPVTSADNVELAVPYISDDDGGPGLNPLINFEALESGYYYLRVAHYANNPGRASTGEYRLRVSATTAVSMEEPASIRPQSLVLDKNYPNPFNPVTHIRYGLSATGGVKLAVYDVQGSLVALLVSGHQEAGWHEITWNGRDDAGSTVSTGLYLARLQSGQDSRSLKMLFLK